jgi:hypothetical protein
MYKIHCVNNDSVIKNGGLGFVLKIRQKSVNFILYHC